MKDTAIQQRKAPNVISEMTFLSYVNPMSLHGLIQFFIQWIMAMNTNINMMA